MSRLVRLLEGFEAGDKGWQSSLIFRDDAEADENSVVVWSREISIWGNMIDPFDSRQPFDMCQFTMTGYYKKCELDLSWKSTKDEYLNGETPAGFTARIWSRQGAVIKAKGQDKNMYYHLSTVQEAEAIMIKVVDARVGKRIKKFGPTGINPKVQKLIDHVRIMAKKYKLPKLDDFLVPDDDHLVMHLDWAFPKMQGADGHLDSISVSDADMQMWLENPGEAFTSFIDALEATCHIEREKYDQYYLYPN